MIQKLRLSTCLITITFLVSSCTTEANFSYPPPNPTVEGALIGGGTGLAVGLMSGGQAWPVMVAGGVVGSMVGNSFGRQLNLQGQLKQSGVDIIAVGDKIRIIIPTDGFYLANSNHINPYYYPVLNEVAAYIRPMTKTTIKVSGYSDFEGDPAAKLALTKAQAQSMADYLWRAKVDARMIYAVGYGAYGAVASNQLASGRASNRRVEITYWLIPKDDEY